MHIAVKCTSIYTQTFWLFKDIKSENFGQIWFQLFLKPYFPRRRWGKYQGIRMLVINLSWWTLFSNTLKQSEIKKMSPVSWKWYKLCALLFLRFSQNPNIVKFSNLEYPEFKNVGTKFVSGHKFIRYKSYLQVNDSVANEIKLGRAWPKLV